MTILRILFVVVLLLINATAPAAPPKYTKITYIHPDGLGNSISIAMNA